MAILEGKRQIFIRYDHALSGVNTGRKIAGIIGALARAADSYSSEDSLRKAIMLIALEFYGLGYEREMILSAFFKTANTRPIIFKAVPEPLTFLNCVLSFQAGVEKEKQP